MVAPNQLMVVAHKSGATTLSVWQEDHTYMERAVRVQQGGQQQVQLRVVVAELDRARLEAQGVDISVAAANAGPRWFQLYVLRDRYLTLSLIRRAEAACYRAILVTCDQPVTAGRRRDVRNGFDRFQAGQPNLVLELGRTRVDALFPNPATSWADLEWVCRESSLPVLLKGVLRADDAREAVRRGAAGVVVSDHGGRQLDRAVASVDALPAVVQEVGGEVPVLLDSGVRSGLDAAIALALGARAVLVGRPVLWGMMASPSDGVAGARLALELLHGELCQAMTLLGAASLEELDASLLG